MAVYGLHRMMMGSEPRFHFPSICDPPAMGAHSLGSTWTRAVTKGGAPREKSVMVVGSLVSIVDEDESARA